MYCYDRIFTPSYFFENELYSDNQISVPINLVIEPLLYIEDGQYKTYAIQPAVERVVAMIGLCGVRKKDDSHSDYLSDKLCQWAFGYSGTHYTPFLSSLNTHTHTHALFCPNTLYFILFILSFDILATSK